VEPVSARYVTAILRSDFAAKIAGTFAPTRPSNEQSREQPHILLSGCTSLALLYTPPQAFHVVRMTAHGSVL